MNETKQKRTRKVHVKVDPVLAASFAAAVISAFFVPPSLKYIEYLDFHVLALLLSLMLVVAGFQRVGVFGFLIRQLLKLAKGTRTLAMVLIGFCFFGSMFITNDVALITFVPLAVMTLTRTGKNKMLIPVIVLQTIAANLGSMFTPIGNPQNLYIYSVSGMTTGEFLKLMALPTAVSLALLLLALLLLPREPVTLKEEKHDPLDVKQIVPWALLFVLCLLTVVRVLSWWLVLIIVIAAVAVLDRKILLRADYGLLLTFCFFFIFIGNMKSIPAVSETLSALVAGRELTCGVLLSQVISNVPAAMLLSGFAGDLSDLIIGVNLGGLGTIIASMASLISYKLYGVTQGAKTGRYMLVFTLANVAFLAVLWGMMLLVR